MLEKGFCGAEQQVTTCSNLLFPCRFHILEAPPQRAFLRAIIYLFTSFNQEHKYKGLKHWTTHVLIPLSSKQQPHSSIVRLTLEMKVKAYTSRSQCEITSFALFSFNHPTQTGVGSPLRTAIVIFVHIFTFENLLVRIQLTASEPIRQGTCVCTPVNGSLLFCLQLWEFLKPNTPLESRISKQWCEIGFQGDDPKTDFRGMGLLGLYNLQ